MNLSIGKRGDAESISWPEVVFIILILAFSAVFFIFAKDTLSGAIIQEEAYAKRIALMLDSAQPGTEIVLDISKLVEVALDSNVQRSSLTDTIKIDDSLHKVIVSLRLGKEYSYSYFSDYKITGSYEPSLGKYSYRIVVEEKDG
jgi:hypothetical protein